MTFSASRASRMYLSRTRLSQMRRGGAPKTGRPSGSSSEDSRSSKAGHPRKESRLGVRQGGERCWLGGAVHRLLAAGAGPPHARLPSAASGPGVFIQSCGRPGAHPTPRPPAHFSGPNFNLAETEAPLPQSALAAPGPRYPRPPRPHRRFSSPPTPKPRPRLQVTFCLSRGLPQPGRHVEAAPPPLPFRGPRPGVGPWTQPPPGQQSPRQIPPQTGAGPGAPRRRHSPRTPISAPRRAVQRPGARPAPVPRALIPGNSMGLGHPPGRRRGLAVRGLPSRGSGRASAAPASGETGGEATGRRGPGDCGCGRGSGLLSACVRACVGVAGGCVREWSPEVGAMRSEQGAGRLGRGFAGAGAARRGRRGCGNTLCPPDPGSGGAAGCAPAGWAGRQRPEGGPLGERRGGPSGLERGLRAASAEVSAKAPNLEAAGRDKSLACPLPAPVLVLGPVWLVLRSLRVYGARNAGVSSSSSSSSLSRTLKIQELNFQGTSRMVCSAGHARTWTSFLCPVIQGSLCGRILKNSEGKLTPE